MLDQKKYPVERWKSHFFLLALIVSTALCDYRF